MRRPAILGTLLGAAALPAAAAELDGALLGASWALPFAGLLLSIALAPLVVPAAWHRHQGKVIAFWSLAFLLPCAFTFGARATADAFAHTLVADYVPFVILLTALYATAGGIVVRGNPHGSPAANTALLGVGGALASVMGTTGASMLLIRPVLRANDDRPNPAHVVIFFIFIVANAGGALTPLGDPPLFLGFLRGVDFFWTTRELLPMTLFIVLALLAIFYVVDSRRYRREARRRPDPTPDTRGLAIEGKLNIALLVMTLAVVLASGMWSTATAFDFFGTRVPAHHIARDLALLAITLASNVLTPAALRRENRFTWAPMREVALLFVGIFITLIPLLAILRAGPNGAFGGLFAALSSPSGVPLPWAYFWLSGAMSAFLDNAPTYLAFFNLAGGDAQTLMTRLSTTLVAISLGSVYMGALSYIGNAPNLMVKAVAEEAGVRMPSFFGYMRWSLAVLTPLFVIITFIWFT